jgi:hypothetical protein
MFHRRRMFAVTATPSQGLYLKARGLAASDQPVDVVAQLKDRFGEITLQAGYHAEPVEVNILQDAVTLMGSSVEIVPLETQIELRNFLQQLLAGLAGISLQSVPERFNLDQLSRDIDLLIKA